jgi:hypothetical protein
MRSQRNTPRPPAIRIKTLSRACRPHAVLSVPCGAAFTIPPMAGHDASVGVWTRHLIPGQSLAFFTQVKLAPLTSFPAQYSESSWWGRQTRSARESKVNIDSVGIITGKLRSLLPIGSTKEYHGGERHLFP